MFSGRRTKHPELIHKSDSVTGAMQRWEERTRLQLNDHWQLIATVLVVIVGVAVAYVVARGRHGRPGRDEPVDRDDRELVAVASPARDHADR